MNSTQLYTINKDSCTINCFFFLQRQVQLVQPDWDGESSPRTRKKSCSCKCHTAGNITIIERSPSPPILVSDASIEDLQSTIKQSTLFKCPLPKDSSSTTPSSEARASRSYRSSKIPRPSTSLQKSRSRLKVKKKLASVKKSSKCVEVQTPETNDKGQECVEELFFNAQVQRSDGSNIVAHCIEACKQDNETKNTTLFTIGPITSDDGTCSCFEIQVQVLKKKLECCRVEKVDVSITADTEMDNQSDIVNTLQNNLGVIEDLYRECFYETAKQESLIDMLRKSYLDVRLMDKQKADQIGRLQNVINTQKWSLERCQDIALEVENLKMEITNFMSSSTPTSNDSGMWERSEESYTSAPGVQEELQDVMEQLLRLREVLIQCDSTCELEAANERLNQENEALQRRIAELCGSKCDLERTLVAKDSIHKKHQEDLEVKEEQIKRMREELTNLRESSREQSATYDKLTKQLRQTQVLLGDKNEEMIRLQQQCDAQQSTINELREELKKADFVCKENCKIRSEVSFLTTQVSQWRAQLEESEQRVRTLDSKLRQAQASYREKESNVAQLQSQLEQAHARSAALCEDARRAVCSVRHWAVRMRDRHREQEIIIKNKNALITTLQRRLEEQQGSSTSVNDAPCSKCSSSTRQTSCCSRLELPPQYFTSASASEMASCSSAPTPPRRSFRKKITSREKQCTGAPWICDISTQPSLESPPLPSSSFRAQSQREPTSSTTRDTSPTDELFMRVERLSEALSDAYRRWTRPDAR